MASLAPRDERFAGDDRFSREWYSKHLRAMSEPSLSCGESGGETYRFTWLPSFHRPIAVRVGREGESMRLTAVQLSGAGGYDPGVIFARTERALSAEEWDSLQVALLRADFWHLPSADLSGGADGAQWIVEARVGNKYHVVDRWSPDSGAFRKLGLLLLKLSALRVSEIY